MRFKEWIEGKNNASNLAIFDFDDTLVFSPDKPKTKEDAEKVGWNQKDWWGSEASLNGDIPFNDEVKMAFINAKKDPNTRVALITGRRGVISHKVRNILQTQNLIGKRIIPSSNKKAVIKDEPHPNEAHPHSHEEYYSGDFITEPDYPKFGKKNKPAADTLSHKIYVISKLMNNSVVNLDMWEDRSEHIPHFIKMMLDFKKQYPNLKNAIIHRIYPDSNHVQHIPIKEGMIY